MTPLPIVDRQAAGPLVGLAIMHSAVGVLERIGEDWDWIWIDAQHGDIDLREAVSLIRTTDLIKRPALVRIPAHDTGWITKVLDAGAAGVIVPMVENLNEAKAMVQAAKFPPLGNRSYGGRRIIDRQGRDYYKAANRDIVLILQVESNEAIAVADQMAALEGVDGLFLGPDDLMIRDGQDVNTPKNRDTIGRQSAIVAESCRRHGKLSVGIGVGEGLMKLAREDRLNLVVGASDVLFLSTGSKATSQTIREFFKGSANAAGGAPGKTLY